ncbi:S8 family peptidase [Ruania albidiflava]|uniref:S8 family peptidase n=1 Tax=Ruania albidiflava TaxID=366586 RepID=UPI0003B666C1|nr:S8 family serine peptidase [Ruania albidiflava]
MGALVAGLIAWGIVARQDGGGAAQPLGSPEAVAAGEDRAADLAGDRPEIAAQQHVEGPQLFSYQFTAEDVLTTDGQAPIIANQLLVTPTEEGGLTAVQALAEDLDAMIVGVNELLSDYQLLLPEALDADQLEALGEETASRAGIRAAGQNALIPLEPAATRPPRVTGAQDAFDEAAGSATLQEGSWGMQAAGVPVLWDYADTVGLGATTVGVFDTFRYFDLPGDLAHAERHIPAGTATATPSAHGLHVAGTVGARGTIRGVASEADLVLAGWPATLLPAEWWPVIRPGYNTDPEEMIEVTDDNALRGGITVLAESGASVINVSQGAPSAAAQLDVDGAQESARRLGETVGHALTRLVEVYPDTLIVAAAGNSACTPSACFDATKELLEENDASSQLLRTEAQWGMFAQAREQFPELADHVLTVGNLDALFDTDDTRTGFEIHGTSQWGADVLAPGTQILSTASCADEDIDCQEGYGYMTGTSMAAPYVAGVAAVLRGVNPDLTAGELKSVIIGTANSTQELVVDLGADRSESPGTPVLDAAAALLVSVRSLDAEVVDLLDWPFPAQLRGAWCPASQADATAEACLDLEQFLEAHPDAELESDALTPVDATGRSSTVATTTLCVDGPCESAAQTIELRYYPPGAAWECTDGVAAADFCTEETIQEWAGSDAPVAHDVAWPRLVQVYRDGGIVQSEPLRLDVVAEGELTGLPASMSADRQPTELTAESTNGTYCAAPDGVDAECYTIDFPTLTYAGGDVYDLRAEDPTAEGCLPLSVEYEPTGDDPGAGFPLGSFCPAGTSITLPDYVDGEDHPDRARIFNSQDGSMMLRERE